MVADRKTLEVRKMKRTKRKDKKVVAWFSGSIETLNGQEVLPDSY